MISQKDSDLLEVDDLKLSSFDDFQKIFKSLASDFDKSEQAITSVQDHLIKLPVPAVNQLRYAGYHMIQALSSMSFQESMNGTSIAISRNHLLAIRSHCLRAYYDAFDDASIVVQKRFNEIVERYEKGGLSLKQEYPEALPLRYELEDLADLRKLANDSYIAEAVKDKSRKEYFYDRLKAKLDIVFAMSKINRGMFDHCNIRLREIEKEELKVIAEKEDSDRNDRLKNEEQDRRDRLLKEESDRKDKRNTRIAIISIVVASIIALGVVVFDSDLKRFGVAFKDYIGINANANAGEAGKITDPKPAQ